MTAAVWSVWRCAEEAVGRARSHERMVEMVVVVVVDMVVLLSGVR